MSDDYDHREMMERGRDLMDKQESKIEQLQAEVERLKAINTELLEALKEVVAVAAAAVAKAKDMTEARIPPIEA